MISKYKSFVKTLTSLKLIQIASMRKDTKKMKTLILEARLELKRRGKK